MVTCVDIKSVDSFLCGQMQDTGSSAFVTLPGCAYATLCVSVSSTSHLKTKYFSATWLDSAFLWGEEGG